MSNNDLDNVRIENYPAFKLYKYKIKTNPVNFESEFSSENLK